MEELLTIGVDFGTDSVRALVVSTATGKELGSAVSYYKRWKEGQYCNPSESRFRHHPKDYLESIEEAISGSLKGLTKEQLSSIKGISVDSTGSTVVAVNRNGTPLALLPGFEENPNAMFILWKDHTANDEAELINKVARRSAIDYTKYVGGIYSSEWLWAKILKTYREDKSIFQNAYSWVELCDWISADLTGNTDPVQMKRSRCAAGHKAMWNQEFDGLPPEEFFTEIDPLLSGIRERLFKDSYTSDEPMGTISKAWAEKFGLSEDVVIGVGAFDCHIGAVGAEATPYAFVRVMGTSTCDILIAPNDEMEGVLVKGICGQVDGSVVPGYLGMEAGQSAYGDYYAWFQKMLTGPVRDLLGEEQANIFSDKILNYLSEKAAGLPVTENDMIATDWINGRRTPDANHTLKAAFMGMNLSTDAVKMFKAIVEATSFGSKAIVDRFLEEGVPIQEVIAIGGVAKKSSFVMQNLADVLNMPIKVASSDQACALGAAMFASVAAGVHPDVKTAQAKMGSGFDNTYHPRPEFVEVYQKLYKKYQNLGKYTENHA